MSKMPDLVRQIIESVYELPGPMPEELLKYGTEEVARSSVRVTKREIIRSLEENWHSIEADIKCDLLEEMSEEEMREAMGDEGFERAAREAGEVIERALAEHRAREAEAQRPILRNRARCRKCGETIESKHRHDFVSCGCGAISVDGGLSYLRRAGNPEDFEELSDFDEDK